jgi:hypothetical protein
VLEVSPFSLAERIAFVGRETEVSRIRAVIDRALTRHGSLVMLWDGSGVGKRQTVLAVISAPHRQRMHASVAEAIGESIPMPLKSAPGRSVTIFSRLERLLTSTN